MWARNAAIGAFVALILGPSSASAQTEQLTCGETVTHSVTLASDVSCPEFGSTGLVVGADGIAIDLNGHSVTGPDGLGFGSGVGIENQGHKGVTIRNGSISLFRDGVDLTGARANRLSHLSVMGQGSAVVINGGAADLVKDSNLIAARVAGISVTGSDGVLLLRNKVSSFGLGIEVASNHTSVIDNSAEGVYGISVGGSSNLIFRNSASNSGVDGIIVGGTYTLVIANTATANHSDGIHVESPSTLIVGNTANDNGNYGIEAVSGVRAFANRATGNGNPLQCLNVTCS